MQPYRSLEPLGRLRQTYWMRHALELARNAQVTVLVLGEAQTMNGEAASRASLSLPGEQEKLLEAVTALGKPVELLALRGHCASHSSPEVPLGEFV